MLGVINLYVKHGHERNRAEENFLTAVANVLAGIVKRKRAEEALSKSEERFDLAVRGTDAGIWDWDLRDQSSLLLAPLEEHAGIRGPRDKEPF